MGRKESNAAKDTDTSYPGLWRTKITYADEPRLREAYSISPSMKLRFDMKNEGALVRENEQEVCVYEDMFEAGFSISVPREW
jgi:hypothetical protein